MVKSGLTKEQAIKKVVSLLETQLKSSDAALDGLYIELGDGFNISCEQAIKNFKVEMW